MPLAWLTFVAVPATLAIAVSCGGLRGPQPLSPVYRATEAGARGDWRYVPLSSARAEYPSDRDFEESAVACEGDPSCLGERGFYRVQCNDAADNDGDGLTDHPEDPGCAGPLALLEAPACDDGLDNDGDGLADWDGGGFTHPDPECDGTGSRDREQRKRRGRFGLPF